MENERSIGAAYILVKLRDHCGGGIVEEMLGLPHVVEASLLAFEDYDMLLRTEGTCCEIKALNFKLLRKHKDVYDTSVLKCDMYMNECGQP